MYRHFYRFRKKPFQVAAAPEFLYKSSRHSNALSYLEYGLTENAGIMVLSGEVGSGKTTTVQFLIKQLIENFNIALILNSNIDADQVIGVVLQEYGLLAEGNSKSDLLNTLNQYLIDNYKAGRRVLLVVDEAQNLSFEALEEVRMLSNLQCQSDPLLQIMLVGQPELLQILHRPQLKQIAQRVAVHYHLTALDKEETVEYISHRLRIAGGDPDLFTSAAAQKVYELSGGIPRLINLVCQAALVYGFSDESRVISQDIIHQISEDNIVIGLEGDDQENPVQTKHDGPANETANLGLHELEGMVADLKNELVDIKVTLGEMLAKIDMERDNKPLIEIERLKVKLQQEKNRYAGLSHDYAVLEQRFNITNDKKKKRRSKFWRTK